MSDPLLDSFDFNVKEASVDQADGDRSGVRAVPAHDGSAIGVADPALPRKSKVALLLTRKQKSKNPEVSSSAGGGGLLFKSFLVIVLIPAIASLMYFALFASDVFVSEAKITVREAFQPAVSASTEKGGASLLGQLNIGKTGDTAQSSMIVMDYIKSRAVVEDVGGRERLMQIYGGGNVDYLSRLGANEDLEHRWAYWKEHVTASVDSLSGILTLRVRAYTPEDAFSLSSQIIQKSEALINNISLRSKSDALTRAKEEVDLSGRMVADARADMLKFQQSNQTIDPIESAKQVLKLISELTLQKTALEGELGTSVSLGIANKPGEAQMRARLGAIDAQITKLNSMLTGTGKEMTVSSLLRDFELLTIQNEFAEYIYKLSRSSYERVRQKFDQQDLYLATVVPPFLPESATYPRVMSSTALIFAGLLIAWGILSLLVASVKDSIT